MTTIKLDPGAALLLDALHGAGHAAYAVGGCVRDSLLGLDPHDWDLCTSARPEQVMALFGEEKCIPTGLQHGTVTVKQGGRLYETTTFRTEGAYSDGRHPDAVCFVPDVREDLARRDFTINAMAYSAEEGLIDPFGGRDDLAAHLVRAVGEPERRFEEDALRILRLYRFAARFGFAIDPATGAAARALGPHLDCVSAERIQEELLKLLAAPGPEAIWNPPFWPLSCRSWNRKNSRNGLRNSAVPSTGSNRQRRTCPPGWRPFSTRWVKPVPAKLCAN
ncbi:MAG: CCA tRNA nucleotidyltransferase [Faecalibacterium sp.]